MSAKRQKEEGSMDVNQMTNKVVEALSKASELALDSKHAVVDVEHVLKSFLSDSQGLYARILGDTAPFLNVVDLRLNSKATSSSVHQENINISYYLNTWMNQANKQRE